MKTEQIRERANPGDIERLSARLRPIRSRREVACRMGVSATLVRQLESSALGKIVRALRRIQNEEIQNDKLNGDASHE